MLTLQQLRDALSVLPSLLFIFDTHGLNSRARSMAKHLTSTSAAAKNRQAHTPPTTRGIIESELKTKGEEK